MTPPNARAPVHPDDACRTCCGKGWQTYPTERQTFLTEPCMTCGGTGAK